MAEHLVFGAFFRVINAGGNLGEAAEERVDVVDIKALDTARSLNGLDDFSAEVADTPDLVSILLDFW